jgi:4-amino-4-deoxy-L-arabinose transferase-like glycosyltransferase
VLAWFPLHVLGESAFALRVPAVLFGVASIGATYLYARKITSEREAVITSLLLATSYHHVWFSQNARGYTLLLFFTITSTYFFEQLLEGDVARAKKAIVPYALTLALGTYSHLTCIFVAMAHFAVYAHVAFWNRERRTWLWPLYGLVAAGVISLALHAPLMHDMLAFFTKPGGGHGKVKSQWTSPLWTIAEIARSLGFGLVPGLLALGSALLVLGAGSWSYAKQSDSMTYPPSSLRLSAFARWLLFVLPGVFGGGVMVLLHRHLWPRFFFFQAAFILLIVVRGLAQLAQWLASAARAKDPARVEQLLNNLALGVLALAWLAMLPRVFLVPKQDFEGAQAYVQSVRKPGEAVVTVGLAVMPYAKYYASDFVPAKSVEELDAALGGKSGYVLSTLPTFVESRTPELAAAIKQRGEEVKKFPGSVGDGAIHVYRLAALQP